MKYFLCLFLFVGCSSYQFKKDDVVIDVRDHNRLLGQVNAKNGEYRLIDGNEKEMFRVFIVEYANLQEKLNPKKPEKKNSKPTKQSK